MENPKKSKLELNPNYVTGFSDGEGCFHLHLDLTIGKNPKYKIGYYVNPGFSIALLIKDEELLKAIPEFFALLCFAPFGSVQSSCTLILPYAYPPYPPKATPKEG